MSKEEYGPLWQLEQRLKSLESEIAAHHADSERALKKAHAATYQVESYRIAIARLKG